MTAFAFAWRSLVRQPARAALGVLGIAAVGALLFDMLLLANGLVLSMRDLLDRSGFGVRVTATAALPGTGPRLTSASALAARIAALPEAEDAVPLRFGTGEIETASGEPPITFAFFGADASRRREWVVTRGRDLAAARGEASGEVVINESLAAVLGRGPGDTVAIRTACRGGASALPPVRFRIAGIAQFPFDTVRQTTAATTRADIVRACGGADDDEADLILVAVAAGHDADAAREAILRLDAGIAAMTNAQVVGRLDASGFSYFRQISAVLATVTSAFGLLLIAVLLTVSVNARLGIIAALRAIGLSRRRVVLDVVCESALMVGAGGLLAIPLGLALARYLDWILKRIPGLPAGLHFFVFEPQALAVHAAILTATAVLAALYPARIVAGLPIAATLRNETVG